LEAPIVKKGDYFYVIHPLTDGIPVISPELLDESVSVMEGILSQVKDVERIVTMEAMGIPLASLLSMKMNIPFTIIRKRSYGLDGEVSVTQKTGYSKNKLFINGLKKGDRVVIVDDVLSTGGTLKAVLSSLIGMGVIVEMVVIAINKGDSINEIQDEMKIPIRTLCDIKVVDGKVVIEKIEESIS
jgi:adenine phosphoribosyltransferase